jgi:hypothetical protein
MTAFRQERADGLICEIATASHLNHLPISKPSVMNFKHHLDLSAISMTIPVDKMNIA